MTAEVAARLAEAVGGQPGVKAAVVATDDPGAVAAARYPAPGRAAALMQFLVARSSAMAETDDMRGLGRVIGESRFEGLSFAGPGEEGVLFTGTAGTVFATLTKGTSAEVFAPALAAAAARYTGGGRPC